MKPTKSHNHMAMSFPGGDSRTLDSLNAPEIIEILK